ncbi:MAG: penicillin-binding protein activator [candidate division Zixibacteria bacterium]|nr:penicillin-binding protein activator [candidate division Zixibacteria bacterium]
MNIRGLLIVILGITVLTPGMATAGNDADVFQEAYDLMMQEKYLKAYNMLVQLCETDRNSRDIDKYMFYKAKAAYYADLLPESMRDLEYIRAAYPQSTYLPYVHLFAGNIHYRYRQIGQALDEYLRGYALSSDPELNDVLIKSIGSAAAASPDRNVIDRITTADIPRAKQCDLLTTVAEQLLAHKKYQQVRTVLQACQSNLARDLIRQAEQSLERKLEIGMVLPLSGELQKFGENIHDGAMLRLAQFMAETGEKITPVVFDTQGKNIEAARIVKQMDREGITAAIGPLTSEEASVASAVLSCTDLPLMVPAATQSGLTELSTSCFQLQPNLDWQGIRMADFAVNRLGADTAAIITPTSADNLSMAGAFAERFEELGGHILTIEYFRIRETDFGPFVKDIKSQIIGELLDSIIFLTDEGDTIDAEAVPVWIDCMYIPAEPSQLQMLLPQVQFYNLNTVFLGSDSWDSKAVYDLDGDVLKTCYFSSGRINTEVNDRYMQFKIDFDHRYGRQPGHLEGLGYDAMSLICDAVRAGKYTRSGIIDYLAAVQNYQGVAGAVTFGANRENTEMPIYTIEYGDPKRVEF